MIVLDYTTRISPTALRAADVSGVSRYIAPAITSTHWKVITKSEYNELIAAGIDVTLNWEFDERDWLSGASVGRAHGTEAASQAKGLGYPRGKVIVGSADFDMTRAQWDAEGREYAEAFAIAIRQGGYRPGVYGPYDVLQWVKTAGYMDAFWQAGMSWSWSQGRNDARSPKQPFPGAHFIQRGHTTVGGVDTDWNQILINPLWGQKKETVMDRIAAVTDPNKPANADDRTKWYFGNGVHYRTIMNWPEHQDLIASGAVEKSFKVSDDWRGWVGRVEAKGSSSAPAVNTTITQEQLNVALASNVEAIASALASHLKVV